MRNEKREPSSNSNSATIISKADPLMQLYFMRILLRIHIDILDKVSIASDREFSKANLNFSLSLVIKQVKLTTVAKIQSDPDV